MPKILKEATPEFTLTMIGTNPICDLECVPSSGGEPIIGSGDPNAKYYPGNTRPNPNYVAGKCVITGDGCCGHPARNALQPQHMRNPDIVRRWLLAKRHLKMERAGDDVT